MFILFSYKTIDPTYVFLQAIGHYIQGDDSVIQSTKLLRIILDTLYDYVNKSKIDSLNSHSHLFKSLNTNLNLLEQQRKKILEDVGKQEEAKKLIESDVEEEIKKIQQKLNEFLSQKNTLLSDESDDDDDDDDE